MWATRKSPPCSEALGDAWYRAGEFRKASEAYTAARELVASDPFADAELLLKLSHVEEKLGKYEHAQAVGGTGARNVCRGWKARRPHGRPRGPARGTPSCCSTRASTPKQSNAPNACVAEAEAVDDPEALGDAYFVMAWAYGELGKEDALPLMQRSLEALSSDRATATGRPMSWRISGRSPIGKATGTMRCPTSSGPRRSVKIGDTVAAALARDNSADILIDRGEWAEAEALLKETLPLWKASQWRYYLAGCLWYLGRASLCLGRFDEAIARLEEAKANFAHVGAEEQIPTVEARIAECHGGQGRCRCRARTGARPDLARERIERRGEGGAAARARAGSRAAEARRPVGRAGTRSRQVSRQHGSARSSSRRRSRCFR